MGSLKEKFGKRIKELRKSKSMTQEQIAEIVGIEPVNISKIERGMHFPQPDKIEKFAAALDVDVKTLFDYEHFQDKTILIKQVDSALKEFDIKKVEMVYKFVLNLDLL